ncbi:MAG: hypothetical protein K1X72_06365 [Pyrinomonadaceae bacterium]|nr:hypothetical protein [Pyrinomonadaceae bacterium]
MNGITPFELHLTTHKISGKKNDDFTALCSEIGGKSLLIELAQGEFMQQPMFTTTIFEKDLEAVLRMARSLAQRFRDSEFPIQRIKVETEEIYSDNFEKLPENYFEWHGKINIKNFPNLFEICQKHKVHLSKNSLKDEPNLRFITLRESCSKEVYQKRLAKLLDDLDLEKIIKQESEFCVYDNNLILDKGWLPE